MSIGNTKDQGNKGNNFPFQLKTLQLLSAINDSIAALPGVDYETRTSTYQAICTICGPGYSTGDIIVRYDIIDVATSTLASTIWYNQTLQTTIAAPAPADLTPISAPSGVTVLNGPLGAAVNIQDGGNSITVDATALDIRTLTFATDAVDVSGSTVRLQDSAGNNITSTGGALDVNIASGVTLEVNLDQTNDSVQVYGSDLTAPIATNALGQLQVDILTLPALTFATDSVDVSGSNVNAVVTATALDIRALLYTYDSITAYQGGGAWDVSGSSVSVSNFPLTQDVNIVSSITLDVSGSNINATQSGTWNVGITGTVPLPTGAATEATLSTISGTASSILSGLSSLNQEATQLLVKTNTDNLDVLLSSRASETTLQSVVDNVTSKIERIKGAANYSRVFTYYPTTSNVATITHTGTTFSGTEQITETFTYVNNLVDGSNVVSIIYGP